MLRPYPAIVLRRYEDESDESFQSRKDQCRNAVNLAGFPGPETFEGNIYDETTVLTEVVGKLDQFPAIFAFESGDLADSRDDFATWLEAIEQAGSKLVLVAHGGIDLRGGTPESDASIRAFAAWRNLAASSETGEEEEDDTTTTELKRPKGMTPEMHTLVREHYVQHGTGSPSLLKKTLGLTSNGTAKNWLVWAEKNPLPAAVPTNEETGEQDPE